jgi:hypothetical protein
MSCIRLCLIHVRIIRGGGAAPIPEPLPLSVRLMHPPSHYTFFYKIYMLKRSTNMQKSVHLHVKKVHEKKSAPPRLKFSEISGSAPVSNNKNRRLKLYQRLY